MPLASKPRDKFRQFDYLGGHAELFTDLETKQRLWEGVFDYDLNAFAPEGPTESPDVAFMSIMPSKAVILKGMGMGGRLVWKAE